MSNMRQELLAVRCDDAPSEEDLQPLKDIRVDMIGIAATATTNQFPMYGTQQLLLSMLCSFPT